MGFRYNEDGTYTFIVSKELYDKFNNALNNKLYDLMENDKFKPGDNVIDKKGKKYRIISKNGWSRIGDGPKIINWDCVKLLNTGNPDRRSMVIRSTPGVIGRFKTFRISEDKLTKI
jgi:hypothetical protein